MQNLLELYFRVPERSARRKSVMPGNSGVSSTPLLQINNADLDIDVEDGSGSEHHSITSINSISSLLKEKLTVRIARNNKRFK